MATLKEYWIELANHDGPVDRVIEKHYSIVEFLQNVLSSYSNRLVKALGFSNPEQTLSELFTPEEYRVVAAGTIETTPSVPTGLTAQETGTTTIEIDHAASTNATWYEYDVDGGDGVQYLFTDLPLTVADLTINTAYTFRVRSGNAKAASAWSAGVAETTAAA